MEPKLAVGLFFFILIFALEHLFPHYPGRLHHLRHSAFNLTMPLLNGILGRFLFVGLNVQLFSFIRLNHFGLLNLSFAAFPIRVILAFLLFDLWMYGWHVANHRIPFLWLFHRAHHNDTEMDASTSLRIHPVEIVISSLMRLPVYALIGMDAAVLAVYESFLMANILFHHSNIALPGKANKILKFLIVTPDMHRMHHSLIPAETNSNYSSILSVWDRLFHTLTKWLDTRNVKLGLSIFREEKWQSPQGILAVPFVTPKGRIYEK